MIFDALEAMNDLLKIIQKDLLIFAESSRTES